jgi:hypothetical protein
MACFLVPTAEAIVTTVIAKTAKEEKKDYTHIDAETGEAVSEKPAKMSFVRKLKWLSNMLWGGAVLLCFEHLWHGEVVPFPPFLTAASNPADTAAMLHEMATAGVCMACLVTAVWIGMVLVSNAIEKRSDAEDVSASQEV